MVYKPRVLFTTVLITVSVIAGWYYFALRETEEIRTPTTTQPAVIPETKTYRNKEWGFEFAHPTDWVVNREHESLTYYSKFFLEMGTPVTVVVDGNNQNAVDSTFLVNIVLPEFVRGFDNLEKTTTEVIVGGVKGIKYEYVFNNSPETTVILPFGELKMILGTGGGSKQYLGEFNQILASFKFLK